MNPSQLKTQLSIDGVSLTEQQNLEIWVLLDKLARIEIKLYEEEKKKVKTRWILGDDYWRYLS